MKAGWESRAGKTGMWDLEDGGQGKVEDDTHEDHSMCDGFTLPFQLRRLRRRGSHEREASWFEWRLAIRRRGRDACLEWRLGREVPREVGATQRHTVRAVPAVAERGIGPQAGRRERKGEMERLGWSARAAGSTWEGASGRERANKWAGGQHVRAPRGVAA
jgi:hypothetical protein